MLHGSPNSWDPTHETLSTMGQKKVLVLLLDKIEAEGFKGGDFLVICDILLETQ